jgi:hypothetical protein
MLALNAFMNLLFRPELQTIFAAAVVVASLLIYRRFADAPTLLLLVGAAVQFINLAGDFSSRTWFLTAGSPWIHPSLAAGYSFNRS